ncbi:hypothetical protein T484DRAFT_1761520 [Baffinella frigidus]|nr:hypothetical protein T484DRAFT_1761520 [Cryptophyta sp. CCMP2293]
MLNTTAFVGAVVLHAFGKAEFFSKQFLAEGFCVANKEASFTLAGYALPLSSHGLCFYSDCVFALVIFLLARSRKDEPAMQPAMKAFPGIIAHGFGHLHLTTIDLAAIQGGPSIFETAPLSVPLPQVAHSLLHSAVLTLFVPPRFGFTYVQTAIMLVFSTTELGRPLSSKDRYFDAYALMVGVPVGFVGWAEALLCESGYRAMGGHVVYDASISITILAYCLLVRAQVFGVTSQLKAASYSV